MFSRTQKINLSPIKQIENLAHRIPDVISLAQGIPSFDTPEIIKKAAIKALNRGAAAKYSLSAGLPDLRETIEEKLAQEGMYYDFENEILVTVGSIEAITAALITIIDGKKNEIILFSPSYASYAEAVKVAGGKPIYANLDEKNGWAVDFNSLEKKITANTAGILLSNPNNPTGTILKKDDIIKLAEIIYKKKIFAITDEVYKDFILSDDDRKILFSLAHIPELRKNIIRTFSMSKAYAMTGWRIGFLHSDESVVKEIAKVHDSMVTCAPVISQYAAIAALDFADDEVEAFRKKFIERKNIICAHLDDLSDYFSYQNPDGAYFVFPKISRTYFEYIKVSGEKQKNSSSGSWLEKDKQFPSSLSWKFALDLLEKAHVAVVPGVAFGPNGENHIRMSFGRSESDINEAFARIKDYFNTAKK